MTRLVWQFVAALVKMAIERFVKSKQNPSAELDDVSDALEKLFTDHIEPAVFQPLPGRFGAIRTSPTVPTPL